MKDKIKLLSIKKLKTGKKKYIAEFQIMSKNGKKRKKSTKFGAKGMSDYTIHKDKQRRERYISRHKKDLRTKDPTRAGYLSMYILWNKPSFKSSVADYKKRLNSYNKNGKFPLAITGSKLKFGDNFFGGGIPLAEPGQPPQTLFDLLPPDLIPQIQDEVSSSEIQTRFRKSLLGKVRASINDMNNIISETNSLENDDEIIKNIMKILKLYKDTLKDLKNYIKKYNQYISTALRGQNPRISRIEIRYMGILYEIKDDIQRICEVNSLLSEEIKLPDGNGTEIYVFEKNNWIEQLKKILEEKLKEFQNNSFGRVYLYPFLIHKTLFRNLPPNIIEKIEKQLQISDIINQYRTYKDKKRVFISITNELGQRQTDNSNEYIFDWDPSDEQSVEWLQEASQLLTKNDLNDIYWKENISNFIVGFAELGQYPTFYSDIQYKNYKLSKKYITILLNKVKFNPPINPVSDETQFYDRQDVLEYFNIVAENQFGKSKAPDNVKNPKLYLKIKAKIQKDVKAKNRRWGAYDSGRLVREYKNQGGKYSGTKKSKTQTNKSSNLDRWYREKWIDACAWPKRTSCGRTKATIKSKVTYCRPSKVIDYNTPKTVQELTKEQIKKRCAKKSKNPKKIIRK